MKSRFWTGIAVAFVGFSAAVAVAKPYGMAGCGLGSMIIKDDGIIQVVAATLNGSSGNQTFGISSGSSNCVKADKVAVLMRQEEFFADNMTTLSRQIAQGEGESVRALSAQLGCSENSYDDFRQTLQSNHSYIFAAPGAMASLQRVRKSLLDGQVGEKCKAII